MEIYVRRSQPSLLLEDLIRSVDDEGDDGHTGLDGATEGTGLELVHLRFLAAGAFGEYDDGAAVLQQRLGLLDGFQGMAGIAAVHEDAVGVGHPLGYDGDLFRLDLCDDGV